MLFQRRSTELFLTFYSCWGRVFDRGFSTISDSPKAKHCAGIYGFRFKLELGLAMIFPAMAESGSPDFGIVVATKYDYPEISNYSMPHGFNCSHLKKLLFKKAPVVINTEMKGHLSDGTCLCFLQYIIHNYERLPKMSLSVEVCLSFLILLTSKLMLVTGTSRQRA